MQATGSKATVIARLVDMDGVFDGFPAEALVCQCLMLDERSGDIDRRSQALVTDVLSRWVSLIGHDLERFPPAGTEALQSIRQRMIDARLALLRLGSLLQESGDDAANRTDLTKEPRTEAGTFGQFQPAARTGSGLGRAAARAATFAGWQPIAPVQSAANELASARR